MARAVKWVYPFSEVEQAEALGGGSWESVRALLGGKGANLADMSRLGVPVPPGFIVTTEACNAFLAGDDEFPEQMWEQELEQIEAIEKVSGKKFGSPDNPLLVSCRSGSKFSMPGMMDTILNIGLNDEVAAGMVAEMGDSRFAYDLYRRLVQMFGSVVLGVPDEVFGAMILAHREAAGAQKDTDLSGDDWRILTEKFKGIVRSYTSGTEFPSDPYEQLKLATAAVFKSWNSNRAIDYRNAAGIPHDLGTAVTIQRMVFGNLGSDSGTGVAMSRNASTGAHELEGDFLLNAQGEDVVAGIRQTLPLTALQSEMPDIYDELVEIARKLETHYRNMQDMEFTIEHDKLWILQARDGKRTAQAEVRIAADMAEEELITREEAVRRVQPEQLDFFFHPQLDPDAALAHKPVAKGLDVSPGAAMGMVAFDADTTQRWADEGKDVIMVRPETKPDDIHGLLAANGIVTARGGRTSHAAVVARQFGKPAVVGVEALGIDFDDRQMTIGSAVVREGDWISIDGSRGEIRLGKLPTVVPDLKNPYLLKILGWADEIRTLGVRANADSPQDAERAREYGAEGIGLCRTEHMFFEKNRLPIVQKMILAKYHSERNDAIDELLPLQRADFEGLFRAMAGYPVIIRLLDPPLHEFLPSHDELVQDLADLKMRLQHFNTMSEVDEALDQVRIKQDFLQRVKALREVNPMLGTRGVRLGILVPELTQMQVRAVFEAACACAKDGVDVHPEIMIPLTMHARELESQATLLRAEAVTVMAEQGVEVEYRFGTMIELPRAALTADEMAHCAEFFSFGTNDLTQTVFGISRDDAERGFLLHYVGNRIVPENPFHTLDAAGVGKLMEIAVTLGRQTRPDLEVGVCGEHGGDPKSIALCHALGLDYVSCSPFRVPIARLAAAHAALGPIGAEEENSRA
jgi:pyruvate,orthophosphate dikinase